MHLRFTTTTWLLLLSVILFVVTVGALVFSYRHYQNTLTEYSTKLQLVADTTEQERRAERIQSVLQTSTQERAKLDRYVLTVVEIASLLETIEEYAERNNIVLSSENLQTNEAEDENGVSFVRIPYEAVGSRAAVMEFLALLETLPYESRVETVRFETQPGPANQVQLGLTVVISYQEV